jgi:hypothetical protein
MKRYYIESAHDVYKDAYNEGETENVNYYNQSRIIEAKSPIQAIKQYFDKELCYSFSIDNLDTDDDGTMYYYVLVDVDNCEATTEEVIQWKQNKKTLYSNNITLSMFKLVGVKIDA